MKLIKIDNAYINIDKIITIYSATQAGVTQTVIEIEGIYMTSHYGDTPVYSQNEIRTNQPIEDIIALITNA